MYKAVSIQFSSGSPSPFQLTIDDDDDDDGADAAGRRGMLEGGYLTYVHLAYATVTILPIVSFNF